MKYITTDERHIRSNISKRSVKVVKIFCSGQKVHPERYTPKDGGEVVIKSLAVKRRYTWSITLKG